MCYTECQSLSGILLMFEKRWTTSKQPRFTDVKCSHSPWCLSFSLCVTGHTKHLFYCGQRCGLFLLGYCFLDTLFYFIPFKIGLDSIVCACMLSPYVALARAGTGDRPGSCCWSGWRTHTLHSWNTPHWQTCNTPGESETLHTHVTISHLMWKISHSCIQLHFSVDYVLIVL